MSVDSHDEPSAIEVYLIFSKCNWYGRGVKVYVGRCESVHLCPVTAVIAYDRGPNPGPVLLYRRGERFICEMRQAL